MMNYLKAGTRGEWRTSRDKDVDEREKREVGKRGGGENREVLGKLSLDAG